MILVLMPLIYPISALAHSFNLVFIAPLLTQTTQSALDGFLLATGEQDAHPAEESDGHLGGLDVYLIMLDSARGESALQASLDTIVAESKPLFAYAIEPSDATRSRLAQAGVSLIEPERAAFWGDDGNPSRPLRRFDGSAFADGFFVTYGRAPDAAARRAYAAARLVAAVVRQSDAQIRREPARLRELLERVLRREAL